MIRASCCLAVAAVLSCASATFAQQAPDWTLDVRLGKPLYLTLFNGDRIEGLAGSITADGVTIATPVGVRTAPFADIRLVQRRDGPWNGIWIGTAVGAALGLGVSFSADAYDGYDVYDTTTAEHVALTLTGAVEGALIGWGIDTLIKGRRTIAENGPTTRVSLTAAPHGVSGGVTVTW